jgi:hypothetical protein
MIVGALLFLLVFAWPLVGAYVPTGFALVLFYLSQPVTQTIAQVTGSNRIGGWDPIPLALAIGLFILRPYVAGRLWRLEMQARARSASEAD